MASCQTATRVACRLVWIRRGLGLSALFCIFWAFVFYQNRLKIVSLGSTVVDSPDIQRKLADVQSTASTQYTDYDHDDMFYQTLEQERRFKILNESCDKLNMPRSLPNYRGIYTSHLIVDDKYKFMFNFIPKVSCSTWKGVMKVLRNSHSRGKRRTLGNYTKEEIQYRLENYRKALFVREPITRLLSAYLSKFCNRQRGQRIWEGSYGRTIVENYRKGYSHVYLDKWSRDSTSPDTFLNITLAEFIQYITDREGKISMNAFTDHFLPEHQVASPCAIHYDFIGHFENLSSEAPYMLKYFGLDQATKYPEYHSSKAAQALIDEYQKVPLHLLKRLQHYFRYDYELFGYSFDDTMKCIIEGSFNDDDSSDDDI